MREQDTKKTFKLRVASTQVKLEQTVTPAKTLDTTLSSIEL